MYKVNKRIGIIEAILYITCTNPQKFYIFEKKYGDIEKLGRYYFNLQYTVDNQPHILLFTFDKLIKDDVKNGNNIDLVLSKKAEEFLNSLEK
jgi:hypothetical protein